MKTNKFTLVWVLAVTMMFWGCGGAGTSGASFGSGSDSGFSGGGGGGLGGGGSGGSGTGGGTGGGSGGGGTGGGDTGGGGTGGGDTGGGTGGGSGGGSGDPAPGSTSTRLEIGLVDADGNPINLATVWVEGTLPEGPVISVTDSEGNVCESPLTDASAASCTNSLGEAVIECVEAGTWELKVAKNGEELDSFEIVCDGTTISVNEIIPDLDQLVLYSVDTDADEILTHYVDEVTGEIRQVATSPAESIKTLINHPFAKVLYGMDTVGNILQWRFSGADGSLASIGLPIANGDAQVDWFIHPDGDTLIMLNRTLKKIVRYAIQSDGTLKEVLPRLSTLSGYIPLDAEMTPDGAHLYVSYTDALGLTGRITHYAINQTTKAVSFVQSLTLPLIGLSLQMSNDGTSLQVNVAGALAVRLAIGNDGALSLLPGSLTLAGEILATVGGPSLCSYSVNAGSPAIVSQFIQQAGVLTEVLPRLQLPGAIELATDKVTELVFTLTNSGLLEAWTVNNDCSLSLANIGLPTTADQGLIAINLGG